MPIHVQDEVPDTGVTREYWLSVEEVACAPDGYNTTCLTYNGTVPGPTLFVSRDAFAFFHLRTSILIDHIRPIGVTH